MSIDLQLVITTSSHQRIRTALARTKVFSRTNYIDTAPNYAQRPTRPPSTPQPEGAPFRGRPSGSAFFASRVGKHEPQKQHCHQERSERSAVAFKNSHDPSSASGSQAPLTVPGCCRQLRHFRVATNRQELRRTNSQFKEC